MTGELNSENNDKTLDGGVIPTTIKTYINVITRHFKLNGDSTSACGTEPFSEKRRVIVDMRHLFLQATMFGHGKKRHNIIIQKNVMAL